MTKNSTITGIYMNPEVELQKKIVALEQQLEKAKREKKGLEKELESKNYFLKLFQEQLKEVDRLMEEKVDKKTLHLQSYANLALEKPDPVFRISFVGKLLFCNEAITKIGQEITMYTHKLNFDTFLQKIAELVEAQQTNVEIEVKTQNAYYSFVCVPIFKESYINVYGRDITTRKKVEHELNNTANRLTTLITNIRSGILVEDNNRKIVLTNQLFCDYFNIPIPASQLVGADCSNSAQQAKYLFKDPEGFVTRVDQILQDQQVVLHEEVAMADGRFLERDFIPIFDGIEYTGHLWKYEDITERKRTQFLLQRSEEKYRQIIENMNLGLMEVDINTIVQYSNLSFCRMLGYTQEEVTGKHAGHILAPGLTKEKENEIRAKRLTGVSDIYEMEVHTKEGEPLWLLGSGGPLYDSQKQVIGTTGIFLDITRQKSMEADLREAISKAEESSRAKEIFLANMSHEIRTPMNAILGMSRLLHKTPLNEQQISFLKAITTSAENLLVIINDILDFSKIEAGKMQVEQVGFEIQETLRQVVEVLSYKAEEKGLLLRTHIHPKVAAVLRGDPYRLNQIFLNLVGNAVKFTNEGHIDIYADVKFETPQMQVIEFKVTDTGIGIDMEKMAHIFDSFTQADNSITRKFGGTGLGLSISKRLIELMGGSMEVISEKDKGTNMTFTLGFDIGNSSDIVKNDIPQNDEYVLKGSKILLVEDNEFNRFLATTILTNYGAIVTEAINGAEAVRICALQNFDLILMDIQMPEMNGYEATEYIRKSLQKSLPIIALTSNAIKGEKEKCLSLGMNDYMSKPFEEKTFILCCASWLGKKYENLKKENFLNIPQASYQKLYNLSILKEFSRGDQSFVQKMVNIFQDTSTEALVQLREYQQAENWTAIGSLAHKMKASIDNMGIQSLKNEIREIETLGKGDIQQLDINRLNELINYVEEVINQVLHSLKEEELV
ncbi:hybrid sensor histidine kinase/response regulator [Xanthocytophaga flava]|uniref:hybrid sensor histidine kinase/response regulator n=1 Tax=Xanthocytophaga flava TaxID=3048013 RepID=UPI0028D675A2|nr:ATP-binding protein [Xanthocytophaga flavus]MDJ1467843.1 ATP-binding protein [Xanthocytophaga flavus]